MVDILAPLCSSVTVTEVIEERAVPAPRLAEAFAPHTAVEVERDPLRALAATQRRAAPDGMILVTGSLFLVGAVYESVRSLPRLATPAT
jgi:folylpolyglutamate synthase/dihydropteroate synthase